ncbi:MAG: YkgJ family cysteine cluster protein [Caldimicrobium sp.]|nr:YkgJ family cysteine cluster protein [Caldimicrobium sp.]MCX7873572.1 YkgJ family cysteine cluster protein [Caldimicrobium sp.]MDW8094043.1 YkgJ family cysteine cluster protein [Caldimicrobium sp.]
MHLPHYNLVFDPKDLTLEDTFSFACHKDIVCFNRCCYDVKLVLSPYDLLRLRTALNLTTEEFLERYGEFYIGEVTQLPIISVNMNPYDYSCPFLNVKEGCEVYPHRPASCRTYPLARYFAESESGDRIELYKIIRETHCKGHYENRPIQVKDFIKEQGLEIYHYYNDLWGEIVLKRQKFAHIPLTGELLDLIYVLAYDLDALREFIKAKELPFFQEEDLAKDSEGLLQKALIIIRDKIITEENLNW